MAEESKCPHCGKPVPPGAPGGLCPQCMVRAGIGSEVADAGAGPKRSGFPPPSLADIARHFPQLEILELLGTGGMGAVYKARQREIDRLVALKILPQEAGSDPGFAERFTREARALAKLSHPNIVALHEFSHVNGLHYFIMEFVDGLNLRQLEQAGRLSAREALQIIPQICEALQFAHDEGIVHRDIKPENVLLDKKGRVKIADFGLARILGHEPEDFRLTRAREVMGTPHYMAPEQVEKPQTVDHRADIYSLGVVFYEMLTGELPLGKFAPPSQKVQIDVRLDEVVLRALEKEPARRYQHASEVKIDRETIMTHQPALTTSTQFPPPASSEARPTRFPRAKVTAATGAVIALASLLAWFCLPRLDPSTKPSPASFQAEAPPQFAAVVPGSPPLGTNADSARRAAEAFSRRYGLDARPAPPSPATNGVSPEAAFAARYGLNPPRPAPGPEATGASPEEAFSRRYGLRPPTPRAETNATFSVTVTGTPPFSYQWHFATNGTTGVTSPGPEGLVVTKLTPLCLKLTLDSVRLADSGPRYVIGVENEAAATPRERTMRRYYCSLNTSGRQDLFTFREAKAPPDNPTNATVVLELKDSGERVTLTEDRPFQRTEGYAADVRYEPENKTWTRQRVGSVLAFGGDEAQIIAITRTEVLLGAKSKGKTWAVEYKDGAPGSDGSPERR